MLIPQSLTYSATRDHKFLMHISLQALYAWALRIYSGWPSLIISESLARIVTNCMHNHSDSIYMVICRSSQLTQPKPLSQATQPTLMSMTSIHVTLKRLNSPMASAGTREEVKARKGFGGTFIFLQVIHSNFGRETYLTRNTKLTTDSTVRTTATGYFCSAG